MYLKFQTRYCYLKEAKKTAEEALTKAKENPEIPEAVMEQMRQQVAADAAQKATEDLQKQLAAAQSKTEELAKAAKEAELAAWVAEKNSRVKKYGTAVADIEKVMADRAAAYRAYLLVSETLANIEVLSLAARGSEAGYKNYDADVDKKIALAMVEHYLANVKPEDKIDVSAAEIENIFAHSDFTSVEKMRAAKESGKDTSNDPAIVLRDKVNAKLREFMPVISSASEALAEPSKAYAAALLDWKKDEPSYPDANSTCRLTYGTIQSYEPKDGVIYKHYTTLKGVMEKEDPGNYEFRVPAKLKDIYENKDYGQYANEKGELVTCFLTNLDITGGNSGSPVLDADGNLIGLAFDGNWEAMSGDVIFEPNLQRCICVDIRYVLLMMDKFGGAGYLLDEMNIIK